MVTSHYEWKSHPWDEKPQVIKQEKKNFPFIENQCWLRRSRVYLWFCWSGHFLCYSFGQYLVSYTGQLYKSDLFRFGSKQYNKLNECAWFFFFTRLTQTLRWCQSKSMVNLSCIHFAQTVCISIVHVFFVKQYQLLLRSGLVIPRLKVLPNVFQPIR